MVRKMLFNHRLQKGFNFKIYVKKNNAGHVAVQMSFYGALGKGNSGLSVISATFFSLRQIKPYAMPTDSFGLRNGFLNVRCTKRYLGIAGSKATSSSCSVG